jgi:uncharacterized hydrophobic protein (TIGR00271 family)
MNVIGTVTPTDIDRITGKLFMTEGDRARNTSAFWVLLVLSAVIATAGIVADSTAAVIGAMIVAPLMTPILGTALAIVLSDRSQMTRSLALVLGGAVTVVAVGFVLGLLVPLDVVATTNGQVAGRVSPRLVDLVAALATGLVGAFALLRSEVSDTLPGVAIAISLVPPLAVVGLTLESGAYDQAAGALLLFGTNVAAIIATGTLLMLVAGTRHTAQEHGQQIGELRGRTLATVGALVVLVAVPLGLGSWNVTQEQLLVSRSQGVAAEWAEAAGWTVTDVSLRQGVLHVVAIGRPPEASEETLRQALDRDGLAEVDVSVTLLYGGSRVLTADGAEG